MSDEEAFASAEEGESEKEVAKAHPEKPSKSSECSKTQQATGRDKGGGKQKVKQQQQQQQRKTKTKAQAKPAADKKEKPVQKKPAEDEPKANSSSEAKSDEPANKKATKDGTQSAATSSGSVKSPAKQSPVNAADSSGVKQGSVTEKDSKNEKKKEENASEEVQEKQNPPQTDVPEKSTETPAKSAGEIRRSLSSDTATEDTKVEKPADQVIPRDSGDDARESGEKEIGDEVSGKSGESDGGWNWGWGSSLLNAATNSLETFSSQVGEGLTTIIDTVESSLGVPDPQELARGDSSSDFGAQSEGAETVTVQPHEKEGSDEPQAETEDMEEKTEAKKTEGKEKEAVAGTDAQEEEQKAEQGSGWFSGWGMSSISNMGKSFVNKSQNLMNTGFEKAETLAAGGLDILETIGKKTYDTLTEHDPGLRRAREFLHKRDEKPSLSSVLRDAQDRAEEEAKHNEELEEARKCNFTALFEDNQGLAHLEALEMLSNQSERKVQSLLSAMDEETLEGIRLQLLEIKDIFQTACESGDKEQPAEESEHDFSKLVTENLSELHLGTAPDKLNKVQESVRQWIADFYSHEDHSEISDPKEVQQRAIQSLADVTSKAVEQFHKAGELVLMQKDEDRSCTHRAQSLAKLCSVLVNEVDILANKFSHCLNKIGEEKNSTEEVSPMVTNVFLEASNASGYVQDAFQLLLPVLQHAALQSVL